MFQGDPQARVKDRDRDRAKYVIAAALRNGQITPQDHDLRIDRVQAAATLGELDALTRDVTALPVSPEASLPPTAVVPPPPAAATTPATTPSTTGASTGTPDPYGPGSTRPVSGVPSDLYGPPPSEWKYTSWGTRRPVKPASGRKTVVGCLMIVGLFFLIPLASGLFLFAATEGGGTEIGTYEPPPAGPPFELTAQGLREYVAAFEETFGSTAVVRTVFYDGYVVAWVPENGGGYSLWNYVDGAFGQLGDPMTNALDTAPVDLADLRPGRVMALVRQAQAFDLEGTVTSYVIYDRDVIEGTPHVMAYVSNDAGQSGYVIGDLDGKVLSRQEPAA